MKIGDIKIINDNYPKEDGANGESVIITKIRKDAAFPIYAVLLSGEYRGEEFLFLENELT